MQKKGKKLIAVIVFIIGCLGVLYFLKDFNLSWVEVNEDYAEVTVNFLVPMKQEEISKHIRIVTSLPYAQEFDYSITWLTDSVMSLKIKEKSEIKGQKINIIIQDAPTCIGGWSKKGNIPIQFKTSIEIISPQEQLLISSTSSFKVQFNTPMNKNQIHKFLQSDATFFIEPIEIITEDGRSIKDTSCFLFTPKEPLANGKKYVLSFKAGMPSVGGSLLREEQILMLQVDEKPVILNTYPQNKDKWIGFYPRFTLESDIPITKAYLEIDGQVIKGDIENQTHASFIPNGLLKPNTTYVAYFQVESATGEKSLAKEVSFTTTTLDDNRLWLEVVTSGKTLVNCYQGTKKIRTMACSIGKGDYAPLLGTYYLQEKSDIYSDYKRSEGANFWLRINENCGFQGSIRDDYWKIKEDYLVQLGEPIDRKNIILSDEDARWIYETVPIQTVIIIRR